MPTGLVLAACLISCGQKDFTEAEVALITDGGETIMHVLQNDVPEEEAFLRQEAIRISDKMLRSEMFDRLCKRMYMTVQDPKNVGVGIAAPQVGISRRLIAVQRHDKVSMPFEFYPNPEIIRYGSEKAEGAEGCLSVPDRRGLVNRAQEIDVKYTLLNGRDTVETIKGFTAVIFQHEIDHLDGILYTDKATAYGNETMETRLIDNGTKVTWIRDNAALRNMPVSLFPDAGEEIIMNLGLQHGIPSSTSVFLLEKDGLRILFDAGNGTDDSLMPKAFESLGISHEDIDYVYITHLHGDHIGGMMKGGEAAFPRAEVYMAKAEHDAWMNDEKNAQQLRMAEAYDGRIKLFAPGDVLPGDVETIDASGHTPGHTAYRSGSFLVIGDLVHGAALQLYYPEFCASFDMDKEAAVASRIRLFDYANKNGLLTGGMHFPEPAFNEAEAQ